MIHQTVDTSLLRIAYDEWNAGAARSVVLLHGWPDSPRCWAAVAPALAQQGWRVLVPALRGFAPTRFLGADTPRTGQLSALGRDLLEFIDALGLRQPALVGHDWGARAAANACGLQPGVASHLVMLSVGRSLSGFGRRKRKSAPAWTVFANFAVPIAGLWAKKAVKNGPLRSICSRRSKARQAPEAPTARTRR